MTARDTAPTYVAMQSAGKAHRILEGQRSSLCGRELTGDHILFDLDDVPTDQRCQRCWLPPRIRTVDDLIEDAVNRATRAYQWGCPGHAEFILTRLTMRLNRLTQETQP